MTARFICPVCAAPLEQSERSLSCQNNHSYDLARDGYVNLISGKAIGPLVGDSADMVHARQAFLGKGFYRPLAESIPASWTNQQPKTILDSGCGEGYYLRELSSKYSSAQRYGVDVSKAAITAAAKSTPDVDFAVCDINRLIPLPEASVDVLICVFAPRNASEFARVIRPGGDLTVVIPATDHLATVRERFGLLDIEPEKAAKIRQQLDEFELTNTKTLEFKIELKSDDIRNLTEMTPNARHMSPEKRGQIEDVEAMNVRAHFEILSFTRK